jgi:competence protein ComFB
MEVHNTVEDKVISKVGQIFEDFEKEGNPEKYCTCIQCRMDVICYALNRVTPHYILSNRGASRVQNDIFKYQQQSADITSLIYEGLKRVNHNQRPNFDHTSVSIESGPITQLPVYNVPTIMGRVFNGDNFTPISDAVVELLWNGELVPMKDGNWQNPCRVVSPTDGNYSFWPAADVASGVDKHKIFEYAIRISAPGFETLNHFFKIPVASEIRVAGSFSLERTFKLPDLYLFPPGEAEKNGYLD